MTQPLLLYGWMVQLSFFFFNLTYSRWTSSLSSCLWSQRIFSSLPDSRLTIFLSRCKFSTLTTRQPMVEFYLLTFPRFPLRKKEHKSCSVRIKLTTSALAGVQVNYETTRAMYIIIELLFNYVIHCFCFVFVWCLCMAIHVISVQYNGRLLPDIILLTQCYYHRRTV